MAQNDMNSVDRPVGSDNRPAKSADSGISVLDIMQVIAENLRLLLLGPLLVGVIAYGLSLLITPTYIATVKFLPPQQQQSAASTMLQSLGVLGGLAGAASGLKNPVDQYVAFLKTNSVQDPLIQRFKLLERYNQKLKQGARALLLANSKITTGKENIISIDFEDRDPAFAARVANAYVEELSSLLNGLAVTEAQQRRAFFEKQLATAKDSLIRAEKALAASGVSVSTLNANPITALEGPARLRAQVTEQEVKMAAMRSYLAPGSSEYRQATAELNAMRAQLTKAEQLQSSPTLPGGTDYIANYREFKYQENLFELFSKQFEIAKIDESRDGSVIQVIDPAQPPEVKSKPRKALIAIGAVFVTGFLLLIFIFLRQSMRNESRNPASAEKMKKLRASFARSVGRG